MESEADMKTLDNRVSSLEKRTDNHGKEIDAIETRVSKVETTQEILKLQLETMKKIETGIEKINGNIVSINDTVTESKHKLDMVDRELNETKQKTKELEKQRNIDHNVKPLESYQNIRNQVIMLLVAAIAGMVLAKFGL